jgi:ferrous iron transport protein A
MRNLTNLQEGETSFIERVAASGAMRGRLFDLGLTEGARVRCAHKNSFGDLAAYTVRGAVIALRREDARNILVR